MKREIKKNSRFLKVTCGLILFATIAIFITKCKEDEKCKVCESKKEGIAPAEFCGDELTEAEKTGDWNCK